MGKKCVDEKCPYFANDGTCLLSECDLKDKCLALEFAHIDEGEKLFHGDHVRERLRALGVLE